MYWDATFSVYSGHGFFVYRNVRVWVADEEHISQAIKRNYNLRKLDYYKISE